MPPKKTGQTVIFVINVGVSQPTEDSNSNFLDKAKIIVKRLIEKKIFLRPKDEIGIILMGSEITDNSLQYPHIQELGPVQIPTWDHVESILNLTQTNCLSNWIQALNLALDYMRREASEVNKKSLILLSDFKEKDEVISQFRFNVATDLLKEGIRLVAIGEAPLENSLAGQRYLSDLCTKIQGCYMTIEEAMEEVKFYKAQPPKLTAWCCALEFGKLKIPISSYVNVVKGVKHVKPWKVMSHPRGQSNRSEVEKYQESMDKFRNVYKPDDILNGYRYGDVFVPFTKEDEEAMRGQKYEKCYKIHSFVKREDLCLDYWGGSGSRLVVPQNELAAPLFYNLIKAMLEESLVAIVRKVYNNSKIAKPKMVALFPTSGTNNKIWCLVEIDLPYTENVRVVDPQPVHSLVKQLTPEQDQAIDNLLDSFSLIDPPGNEQLFSPGTVPSPSIQHVWNSLSHRALHAKDKLPPMDEDLIKLLKPPPHIKERSVECIARVESLFDLVKPIPKSEIMIDQHRVLPPKKVDEDEEEEEPDNTDMGIDLEKLVSRNDLNPKWDQLNNFLKASNEGDLKMDYM